MKLFTLLVLTVALAGVSCERHEFEGPNGTKQMNEPHSSHGKAEHHDDKGGGH